MLTIFHLSSARNAEQEESRRRQKSDEASLRPQLARVQVDQWRHNGLYRRELRVEAEGEEHHEEKERPQGGDGQLGDGFRVRDERKTESWWKQFF